MTVQHVNRRGQTYYLHQGQTKTGKPKYYFSMKAEGNLVYTVPDGYETYENPNAQVFLRRVRPKIIRDDEVAIVEQGVANFAYVPYYIVDVRDKAIVVYLADQDMDLLLNAFDTDFLPRPDAAALSRFLICIIEYVCLITYNGSATRCSGKTIEIWSTSLNKSASNSCRVKKARKR